MPCKGRQNGNKTKAKNLLCAGIGLGVCVLLLSVGTAGAKQAGKRDIDLSAIHGRIQFVNALPDYKVQVVTSLPDLRVKRATARDCG